MLLLIISTLVKIGVVLGIIGTAAPILVWAERRQSSMMQDRVGPVRAGIPLPRGLWNLIIPASIALILGGWLMDATLTLVYVVLGQPDLVLDQGTMVYSWVPVLGPFLQLLLLDNPWSYNVLPVVSGLTQIGGCALLSTAVFLKDRLSVAEFIRGPVATAATGVAYLSIAFAGLAVVGGFYFVWEYGATGVSESGMSAGTYFGMAFIGALVAGFHVCASWIVRNSVDKRGHLTLFGLLHPLADVLKTAFKEDFIPPNSDKLLHSAAPIIALIPAFATFAVIPFGPDLHWGPEGESLVWLFTAMPEGAAANGTIIPLQVASINVGILYIFAIAGTGIVGAAIAGYSSDNKFSLLGGLRAASQMVSYEVILGLTLVGCFMVYNTLLLDEMVAWQQSHVWGCVVQPLALVLFFFAAIAEMKRIPFDAPEGESEIVAGYMLEYSSMKFLMFMTGEFVEHVVSSGIIVTLFFGGYTLPFLHSDGFHFDYLGFDILLPHIVVVIAGIVVFVLKMVVIMFLQLQVRWTLPRFRYDQIMQLCWKIILPLSLANIIITGVVILLLQ